jgi:hypothetical protein
MLTLVCTLAIALENSKSTESALTVAHGLRAELPDVTIKYHVMCLIAIVSTWVSPNDMSKCVCRNILVKLRSFIITEYCYLTALQ